jgi:hypothetical protein
MKPPDGMVPYSLVGTDVIPGTEGGLLDLAC